MGAQDRKTPRYSRQLDVNIEGLEIVTTNVSAGGIQLSCPEMRYGGFQSAETDGELGLKIRLPGTKTWLQISAAIKYADLCDDEYLIGVQFTAFDGAGASEWANYIETLSGSRVLAS